MSLRNVVSEWVKWGLEPGELDSLSVEDQLQFCADVMQANSEWTFDAFAEGFSRKPGKRAELEAALRNRDWMQVGAAVEFVFRDYIIRQCSSHWEAEFQMVSEEESEYQGDE
jgi:hypothetical protein